MKCFVHRNFLVESLLYSEVFDFFFLKYSPALRNLIPVCKEHFHCFITESSSSVKNTFQTIEFERQMDKATDPPLSRCLFELASFSLPALIFTIEPRLVSKPWQLACFSLPSTCILGNHTQLYHQDFNKRLF